MKNVVGGRIRESRLKARPRVSQELLAARMQAMGLEIDQTAISRIEHGERLITDVEILAICQSLGITAESIFAGLKLPLTS